MTTAPILVVDDDEDVRQVVALVLSMEGYVVETARDGCDALDRLATIPRPALVLVDLMMPNLDGEGFIEAVRRRPALSNVPLVLVSGHQLTESELERLGTAAYLVKPVERTLLLATVASLASTEARA